MKKTININARSRYAHSNGYWPAFLVLSLVVHVFGYSILTDNLRTFLEQLPEPLKFYQNIMEVELVVATGDEAADIRRGMMEQGEPPAREKEELAEPARPEPVEGPKDKSRAAPAEPEHARVEPERAPEPARPPPPSEDRIGRPEGPDVSPPKPVTVPKQDVEPPQVVRRPSPDIPLPEMKTAEPVVDRRVITPEDTVRRAVKVSPVSMEDKTSEAPGEKVTVIRGSSSEVYNIASVEDVPQPAFGNMTAQEPDNPVPGPESPFAAVTSVEPDETVKSRATAPFAPLTTLMTRVMRPDVLIRSIMPHYGRTSPKPDDMLARAERTTTPVVGSRISPGRPVGHDVHTGTEHAGVREDVAAGLSKRLEPGGTASAPPMPKHDYGNRLPVRISLPLPRSLVSHSLSAADFPTVKDSDREGKKPGIVLLVELPSIPLPGPEVSFDSPSEDETHTGTVTFSGTATGTGVTSVLLSMGEFKRELLLQDGRFVSDIPLMEGSNVVVATVVDRAGKQARATRSIVFQPPSVAPGAYINSPSDGDVVDTHMTGMVGVTGTAQGAGIGFVRVYVNSEPYDTEPVVGMFSVRVPVLLGENVLFAETTDMYGNTARSPSVRFSAENIYPKDLFVMVRYNDMPESASITTSWRPHPLSDARKYDDDRPYFDRVSDSSGGVIGVGYASPGIYTVGIEYDNPGLEEIEATFEVTLFGMDPDKRRKRIIGPLGISGKGYIPAVRVMLPEGVFWEDESFFSGTIETSEGTTRYRQPEGIVWKEED